MRSLSALPTVFTLLLSAAGHSWPRTMVAAFGFRAPTRGISQRPTSFGQATNEPSCDDETDFSLEAFQRARAMTNEPVVDDELSDDQAPFDGYDFRDIIVAKWGQCYDVEFQRVDIMGFRKVYLNIMPFHLGRRPFRHANEYDYLCHLQAVVEILQEYGQLSNVLYQIGETKKRPLPGRSPIVAVPCRLELTDEQVRTILG